MGRRTLIAVPVLLVAAMLGSTHACGNAATASQFDGGTVCAHGDKTPCPAGTDCINSICTTTCDGGSACQAGAYCTVDQQTPEGVCAAVKPTLCGNAFDCPAPQRCFHGVCASIEPRQSGSQLGCLPGKVDDACGSDAICSQLTDPKSGQLLNDCLGLPQCGQAGDCPIGDLGTVCNDGRQLDGGQLFPGKQRLCLVGFCTKDTDCQSALKQHCFAPSPTTDALGTCNNGTAGNPCFTNKDCYNATGCFLADGGVDDGGAIGVCK